MITLDKFKKNNPIIIKLLLILTFCITFCISLNTTNATGIPRDGLVGEWLLNGNSNDTSGNGNDGAGNNVSYSSSSIGIQKQHANFDGGTSSIIMSSPIQNNTPEISISFWFNTSNISGGYKMLFINRITNATKYHYIALNGNKIEFMVFNESAQGSIGLLSNSNISTGIDYLITCTYKSGSQKIYINGVLDIESTTLTGNTGLDTSSTVRIGMNDWSQYYLGYIQGLLYYNRVLTPSEVFAIYSEDVAPSCINGIKDQNETSIDLGGICGSISRNGLIGEWLLNGNTNDTSGYGNNGISTNVDWISSNLLSQTQAGSFNGNSSYIELSNSTSLKPSSYTYSAWIKLDAINAFQKAIISDNPDGSNGRWFGVDFDNKILGGHMTMYNVKGTTTLDANKWYLATITYDAPSTTMKVYTNGILETTDSSYPQNNNGNVMYIGTVNPGQFYFNGTLQAIKIYNRVLSSTEIQSLYNEGVVPLNGSSSWRRSCGEQKASTHYGVSIVKIKGKNGIKLTWQNPDGAVKTIISKNLIEDINLDITKTEYIDYNIELGKKYTYYIKSTNSCGNVGVTEKIEITYDNNPVFAMSDLNNSNNSLSFFIAKYGDFGASNLRVSGYLTSGSGTVNKFLPRVNELYNFGYLKQGAYNLKVQIEDSNGNIYKNYTVEKDIYVTSASTSSIDLGLSAEDSGPDYINYKYSITTKSFDFKNTVAKVAILDAISKKVIRENSITLNSDSNNLTNNSFTYKEGYLEPNTLHKRVIRLTIGESGDPIYSDIYDFKVGDLKGFSLDYDDKNKIFSWNKANLTNIVYSFQCKSTDGGADIFKQIKNSLKYKDDTINKIENGNYVCSVSYFKDGYVYKSSEKGFGENMRMTKNTAYKSFMDIYSNGTAVNYDKKALKLGIINDVSEKNNPIKWIEYAKLLFKVYGELTFDQKKYDKSSYDEFSKLLTNMIGIVDVDVMKGEFDDLKAYLKDNNDRFKTRVQNVFNYKDEIVEFINSGKSEDSKAILKNRIANYFFISK